MDLKDKVVLITGASRGIGRATAVLAAREGARVVVTGRNQNDIDATILELGKEYAFGIRVDIRTSPEVKKMIEATVKKFGRIDILINNAGVYHGKDFLEQTEEEWNEEIDINVKGMLNCTYITAPLMVKQNNGVIVNISSGLGKCGLPGQASYCASKFAVIGFTQAFAQEVEHLGIRVYAVCPGTTATDMTGNIGMPTEKVAGRIIACAKEELGLQSGEDMEIYS